MSGNFCKFHVEFLFEGYLLGIELSELGKYFFGECNFLRIHGGCITYLGHPYVSIVKPMLNKTLTKPMLNKILTK